MTAQVHSFQAEVQQLLHLMIHSLYSNKEIFLRELISNGSDALDKLRFAEAQSQKVIPSDRDKSIIIRLLADEKKIIIEDNGIGMNQEDLIKNLGTIANSGTKKFLTELSEEKKKDSNLIGQFGVGFYSAFMVAEKIEVETCSALTGESAIWTSAGDGSYTIDTSDKKTRGTTITLYLKPEESEFLEEHRIQSIVKKYSDYITYPVLSFDKEGKENRLNQSTPLWSRSKKDVKDEEYINFYKQLTYDWRDPLAWDHFSVEGLTPFQGLLYIPSEAPFDLYTKDTHGLHLYTKRVSISERCKEVLPEYLRFVSGVVETDEIPLNVSREILQHNAKLPLIKKQISKRLLNLLKRMMDNEPEQYKTFFKTFGPVLKEGFHFDREHHEILAELVCFRSTFLGDDVSVSLQDYVSRMKPGQKHIYYLTGLNYDSIAHSPHLEALTALDIEVLLLADPIDEWVVMSYPKHKDFEFASINKGQIDLSEIENLSPKKEDTKPNDSSEQELAPLVASFKQHLENEISDVTLSKRLKESSCCLVDSDAGLSRNMERIMMMSGQKSPLPTKKILEINPRHPVIQSLVKLKASGTHDAALGTWMDLLYDTALLAEGSSIKNPADFAKKISSALEKAVSSDLHVH